jgi:hypothetical protein
VENSGCAGASTPDRPPRMISTLARRVAEDAGAAAAYLVLSIAMTYPLVRRFDRAFLGAGTDVFSFLWNNWWLHHAITHHLPKPYLTTFIFAPFRLDLRLHTAGFLYGLVAVPFFGWLGQIRVLNLQILATLTLNGYFTFWLVRRLTRDAAIAFLCGLLAASLHAINLHIPAGRASCGAFWTAIAALSCFLTLTERPRPAAGAFLAVSLVAMFLADLQVALFGSMWLALLGAALFLSRGGWARLRRLGPALIVPAAAVLLAAYVLYFRPARLDVGYDVPDAVEAQSYSDGPSAFLHFNLAWASYGIILPLAFPVVLARLGQVRRAIPWALGAVLFFLLSYGPTLEGTAIPLPFALLRHLPGLANFRTPYRFAMPAAFGAIVSLGLVLHAVTKRLDRRARSLVVCGLVLVALADEARVRHARPFMIREMPLQPIYEQIGRDPTPSVLLEIPVGVRNGTDRIGAEGEILTFYQPIHGKRLVNGIATRSPTAAIDYGRASPALMYLAGETPPPGDVMADLQKKMAELRVGYVVVHPDMMKPERVAPTLGMLAKIPGLTRIAEDPDLFAWRRESP